jgi:hypothetical protein
MALKFSTHAPVTPKEATASMTAARGAMGAPDFGAHPGHGVSPITQMVTGAPGVAKRNVVVSPMAATKASPSPGVVGKNAPGKRSVKVGSKATY